MSSVLTRSPDVLIGLSASRELYPATKCPDSARCSNTSPDAPSHPASPVKKTTSVPAVPGTAGLT
jgi:hypothetical protein